MSRNRESNFSARRGDNHNFVMFGDVDRSEKLDMNPRRAKERIRGKKRAKDHERAW